MFISYSTLRLKGTWKEVKKKKKVNLVALIINLMGKKMETIGLFLVTCEFKLVWLIPFSKLFPAGVRVH